MQPLITLNCDSPEIIYLSSKDKHLAKLIHMVGEISYQPYKDEYSFIIREIIEQMLSIKAGAKIYSRLLSLCEGNICPEIIDHLTDEQLRSTGTSRNKVSYIRSLNEAISNNSLILSELTTASDHDVIHKLTSVKGIGTWTAKMYLIFVLNRPNILPTEDVAFLQVYKWLYNTTDISKNAITKKCSKWSPYSSIAARYMYRALDMGLTKTRFHLFKN